MGSLFSEVLILTQSPHPGNIWVTWTSFDMVKVTVKLGVQI